jgi:hypothetical protein
MEQNRLRTPALENRSIGTNFHINEGFLWRNSLLLELLIGMAGEMEDNCEIYDIFKRYFCDA